MTNFSAATFSLHIPVTAIGKKGTGLTTLNSAKDGIIKVPFFLIQTEHYSVFEIDDVGTPVLWNLPTNNPHVELIHELLCLLK